MRKKVTLFVLISLLLTGCADKNEVVEDIPVVPQLQVVTPSEAKEEKPKPKNDGRIDITQASQGNANNEIVSKEDDSKMTPEIVYRDFLEHGKVAYTDSEFGKKYTSRVNQGKGFQGSLYDIMNQYALQCGSENIKVSYGYIQGENNMKDLYVKIYNSDAKNIDKYVLHTVITRKHDEPIIIFQDYSYEYSDFEIDSTGNIRVEDNSTDCDYITYMNIDGFDFNIILKVTNEYLYYMNYDFDGYDNKVLLDSYISLADIDGKGYTVFNLVDFEGKEDLKELLKKYGLVNGVLVPSYDYVLEELGGNRKFILDEYNLDMEELVL